MVLVSRMAAARIVAHGQCLQLEWKQLRIEVVQCDWWIGRETAASQAQSKSGTASMSFEAKPDEPAVGASHTQTTEENLVMSVSDLEGESKAIKMMGAGLYERA